MKQDNSVVDAATQTMRCELCGDEVPIPLGSLPWVSGVMLAFAKAHEGGPHSCNRTTFSVPKAKDGKDGHRQL